MLVLTSPSGFSIKNVTIWGLLKIISSAYFESISTKWEHVLRRSLNCWDLLQKPNVRLFNIFMMSSWYECSFFSKRAKNLTKPGDERFFSKKWISLSWRISFFRFAGMKHWIFSETATLISGFLLISASISLAYLRLILISLLFFLIFYSTSSLSNSSWSLSSSSESWSEWDSKACSSLF